MELRRNRVTTSVRTEGGLLPADLLAKIAASDRDVPGLADADYGLAAGERAREAITRSWNRLVGAWAALEAVRVDAEADAALTGATRERFLLPLFDELGFGRLAVARPVEIEGTSYPISHGWGDRAPIHLVGFEVPLDRRTPGVRGAAGAAPHALVQEYLNRSDDALWGLVSNGRILRLLRDSTSLTRQAFVEFDLEAIFEGELFADFALLWSVLHRTRFDGDRPADCLLEQWTKKAAEDGTRALDKLRGGVERAIETLGAGFLAHPSNGALREALRSGALVRQDYYRELLRLVYRLVFLFTAEDRRDEDTGRELLLDPAAPDESADRYRRFYSTARLRSLAARRRGTRHPDLWVGLRRVVGALGSEGAPTLALPALGSFLFSPDACRHLDGADLRNEDLLDAVRALATIEEDRRLRAVDYRNLGAEELGAIYEGLLELHPRIEVDANPPRFALDTAAGNERKSTGSYYTPTSLITVLLDSALDPLVDDAVRGKDGAEAEAALLALAIVDPAAGSGHFLVATAHRLAKRLAAIRTGDEEPAPGATRHALRDVIAHCIYAVDINPMAVELCKVSLWLEALEPGRPLSFLDAHIKGGNSLLGTTPELVEAGVPDDAYVSLTGDSKEAVRRARAQNRIERKGQQSLLEAPLTLATGTLAASIRSVEALPEDTVAGVGAKAARHAAVVSSSDYRHARLVLDAWCAAFVAPRTVDGPDVTTAVVRLLGTRPESAPPPILELVTKVAADYEFFHWPLEFPSVMGGGGFDLVVGNPPWERIKLQEQEFFAERSPVIAGAKNAAARKRLIAALETTDPALWAAYRAALRRADGEGHFLRDSGVYPLAGRGDINTYAVFTEAALAHRGKKGWAGIIVPSAVATDETTSYVFRSMVDDNSLRSLYDFRNSDAMFKDVGHRRFKFCLLTVSPPGRSPSADLAFFAVLPRDLEDEWRHFTLSSADFALLNPNSRTCPTLRSRADAELVKGVYRRTPVLVDKAIGHDGNPWGVSFLRMFDMANDSGLFLDEGGDDRLPLYEAKMAYQLDHRYGDYALRRPGSLDTELPRIAPERLADRSYRLTPRYWVRASDVRAALRPEFQQSRIGWRDITNATNERTVIAAALPLAAVGHTMPMAATSVAPGLGFALLANLNSMALDYIARQKLGGTHLTYGVLEQLPVLPPEAYEAACPWASMSLGDWLRRRVVELVVTADDIADFGTGAGYSGPPFRWDPDRRPVLLAEVDAAYLHLYGLGRPDVLHILDAFPIVRRKDEEALGSYRTRDLVLAAYEALATASPESPFTSELDPPPGDPRAAHRPRAGEETASWQPWSDLMDQKPAAGPRRVVAQAQRAPKPRSLAASTVPGAMTLDLGSSESGGQRWLGEASVDPGSLMFGTRVRHRAFGPGTITSVQQSAATTHLLIEFDNGGGKSIAFGYGLLEFEA